MLNFKELPKDGDAFELLIRELLLMKGFHVHWSGKGPDGGRDLICYEDRPSEFQADRKTWLIQCKHKAHSGGSVGVADLDDITGCCEQHGADAYLLACSTVPSSTVIDRLEGITANPKTRLTATYWDATIIEQKLSTPTLWRVAQLFFPKSSKNSTWEIYATERPNEWIANCQGYHFHLSNRIGSKDYNHFESIEARIKDIKHVEGQMPEGHIIRIRSVNFDDKHGAYNWTLDYLFPHTEVPIFYSSQIAKFLGDGWSLQDGQMYSFDVISRPYHPYNDHYDKDHYEYYTPYLNDFREGKPRKLTRTESEKRLVEREAIREQEKLNKVRWFNDFKQALASVPFVNIISSRNSDVENLDKFGKNRDLRGTIEEYDIDVNHLFSAWFRVDVGEHKQDFLKLITHFSLDTIHFVRIAQAYIFMPNDEGQVKYDEEENSLFDLTFEINPAAALTAAIVRQELNQYFLECTEVIKQFLATYYKDSA